MMTYCHLSIYAKVSYMSNIKESVRTLCITITLHRGVSMSDAKLRQLADNIRRYITASTYRPAEIARTLGVDKSAISRWMSGERTPTAQNLIELADLLQIEVTDLWGSEKTLPKTPEQRLMIDLMRKMTSIQQETFLAMAKTLIGAVSISEQQKPA